MKTRWVYLLHFSQPIGSKKHQAMHYMGSAIEPFSRIRQHWLGKSRSCISNAFHERGIPFRVGFMCEGDRQMERRLKNRHNHSKLCQICREEGK